jgi:hypothetical protein
MAKVKKETLDEYYNKTGLRKRFYISNQRSPRVLALDETVEEARLTEDQKKSIETMEVGQILHFPKVNILRYWDEGRGRIGIYSQHIPSLLDRMKESAIEMKLFLP